MLPAKRAHVPASQGYREGVCSQALCVLSRTQQNSTKKWWQDPRCSGAQASGELPSTAIGTKPVTTRNCTEAFAGALGCTLFLKGDRSPLSSPPPTPQSRKQQGDGAGGGARGQEGIWSGRIPRRPAQHSFQQPPHLALPRPQSGPAQAPSAGEGEEVAYTSQAEAREGSSGHFHGPGVETEVPREEGTCLRSPSAHHGQGR